jgi:hypothetical protein
MSETDAEPDSVASSSGQPYALERDSCTTTAKIQAEFDSHESGIEGELEKIESDLRQNVPALLESMNSACQNVNTLERQAQEAQGRYNELLAARSRLYEDIRMRHGNNVDRARPYFDVALELSNFSQAVQASVSDFSAAVSQYSQAKQELHAVEQRVAYGAHKVVLESEQQSALSSATVRVLLCQKERDRCEQESAQALREYQRVQERVEEQRALVGDTVIRRMRSSFRKLQAHQKELEEVQRQLAECDRKTKASKELYNSSLRGLDQINVAVHTARKDFVSRTSSSVLRPD